MAGRSHLSHETAATPSEHGGRARMHTDEIRGSLSTCIAVHLDATISMTVDPKFVSSSIVADSVRPHSRSRSFPGVSASFRLFPAIRTGGNGRDCRPEPGRICFAGQSDPPESNLGGKSRELSQHFGNQIFRQKRPIERSKPVKPSQTITWHRSFDQRAAKTPILRFP